MDYQEIKSMCKVSLFVIVLLFASCVDNQRKSNQGPSIIRYKPDSTALKLNNKASWLIGKAGHTYDSLKTQLYDSAIFYLNQAIEIDSLYLLAYTNKAQALQRRGLLEEALQVLKEVENIKPDFPEVKTAQGFLLEKMGNMNLATRKYREALNDYENKMEDDPMNDKVQSDIAFLYIFLEDKEFALDEVRNSIIENPKSEQLKLMESIIKDFDRRKFIEEY